MFVALVVIVVVVASTFVGTGVTKLARRPRVVEKLTKRLGVPPAMLTPIGLVDLAGAAGLLVGLRWAPLGITAAIAGVGYFSSAVSIEARGGGGRRDVLPPLLLGFLCIVAAGLRGATAP